MLVPVTVARQGVSTHRHWRIHVRRGHRLHRLRDARLMRIRFSIELHIDREREESEQFEHRDNDTLVESIGQPRYIGFQRDDQRDD